MTHAELVDRAARWLRGTMRCDPVLTEYGCWATPEQPDAFGVNSDGTVVVECKTSISDFYADGRKPYRRQPHYGMGRRRYYLTPRGLISPQRLTLRPGWGLLEVVGRIIRVRRQSEIFAVHSNAEALLLRSAILHSRVDTEKGDHD